MISGLTKKFALTHNIHHFCSKIIRPISVLYLGAEVVARSEFSTILLNHIKGKCLRYFAIGLMLLGISILLVRRKNYVFQIWWCT